MPTADIIASHLDEVLRVREIPDYAPALNGLQIECAATVRRVAAAVDFSLRTIDGAIDAGAQMLLVHHGMFWGGLQPIRGRRYRQLRRLVTNEVAVYAAHLPLDVHPELGNNVLLARELGLEPAAGFARYETIDVGVRGDCDLPTRELVERVEHFARRFGGQVIVSPGEMEGRRTRRWALCTGAGASSESIGEALELGVDTLIVGEGPHHTAVDAADQGLVVIYAGHYATEVLGVRALAAHVEAQFGVPWTFIDAPTGL